MSILSTNKLLVDTEKRIERDLTPKTREAFEKIVVAGLKVGLRGGPNSILASVRQSKDPISDCAVGAVGLVLMLRRQSRNTMPEAAAVPATMVLMLSALDFVEKAGIAKVGADELNRATRICGVKILEAAGVTPQMLKAAGANVQSIMKDPAKMDILGKKSGVLRDAAASMPSGIINGG